ncbi:hypothetical protein J2Z37_005054 [Ammoniphilus resinae]|uniref:Uncharacterized protein n=2 Tax=Ammoniphilus resinae TaxID=861532 RepID=A0ABS4GXP7_9BACL|nr:hypothetical protein [Ammoniphilus resinae]
MISAQKFQALKDLVNDGKEIPVLVTSEPFAVRVIDLLGVGKKALVIHRLIKELVKNEEDLYELIKLWQYRNKIFNTLMKMKRAKVTV